VQKINSNQQSNNKSVEENQVVAKPSPAVQGNDLDQAEENDGDLAEFDGNVNSWD